MKGKTKVVVKYRYRCKYDRMSCYDLYKHRDYIDYWLDRKDCSR